MQSRLAADIRDMTEFNGDKLHAVAGILLVVGSILLLVTHSGLLFVSIFFIALAIFATGMILRYLPRVIGTWKRIPEWLRKAFLTSIWASSLGLIPAGIYFASAIYAKNAVADVLQMPAKDYPTTVHLLTVCACVSMWILFAAALLLAAIVVGISRVLYLIITSQGASMLSVVSALWGTSPSALEEYGQSQNRKGLFLLCDLLGAVFLLGICFNIGYHGLPRSSPLIKWIAYHADYLPARNYPGLDKLESNPCARVVFHDNAVVSFAIPDGSDVKIISRMLKQ